jgi:hypothetical protein
VKDRANLQAKSQHVYDIHVETTGGVWMGRHGTDQWLNLVRLRGGHIGEREGKRRRKLRR